MDENTFERRLKHCFEERKSALGTNDVDEVYATRSSPDSAERLRLSKTASDLADELLNSTDKLNGPQQLQVLLEFTPLAICRGDFARASTYTSRLSQLVDEHEELNHLKSTAWVFHGQTLLAQGKVSESLELLQQQPLPFTNDGHLLIASGWLIGFLRELVSSEEALKAGSKAVVLQYSKDLVEKLKKDSPFDPQKPDFVAFIEDLS